MAVRVAFLRAINLGGRRVTMPQLVGIFKDAGFADAWTYINSGNVVFEATGRRAEVERRLEDALEKTLGFEVTTFVRTSGELRHAVAAEPFAVSAGDTYFLTFLKSSPSAADRSALESLTNGFDTLVVAGRTVHWRMHGKSTDTRLKTKDWERIAGRHRSTSRNMTMLRRLQSKMQR
ncbi:MAG: DUF1697 domain-containing protein [Actinomycetota bacterium]|nr:DUF1697 domain-containing protein [Actinomycetota bacterium]